MPDFQKPFPNPEANEEEAVEELRNSEIAMLVALALMGAVGLWMYLNPGGTAPEESSRPGFQQVDDGHVYEFSESSTAISPQESVALSEERRRMEDLHATPPPEAPRPGEVSAQANAMGADYENSGLGKHRELFEGGKVPDLNQLDMNQFVPDQVWEAGVSRDEMRRQIDESMKKQAAPSF